MASLEEIARQVGLFEEEEFFETLYQLKMAGRVRSEVFNHIKFLLPLCHINPRVGFTSVQLLALKSLAQALFVASTELDLDAEALQLIKGIGPELATKILGITPPQEEPELELEPEESINLPIMGLPLLTIEDEVAEILETGIFSGHSAEAQRLALIKMEEDTEVFMATEVPEDVKR